MTANIININGFVFHPVPDDHRHAGCWVSELARASAEWALAKADERGLFAPFGAFWDNWSGRDDRSEFDYLFLRRPPEGDIPTRPDSTADLANLRAEVETWRANDGGLTMAAVDILGVISTAENDIARLPHMTVAELQRLGDDWMAVIETATTGAEADVAYVVLDAIAKAALEAARRETKDDVEAAAKAWLAVRRRAEDEYGVSPLQVWGTIPNRTRRNLMYYAASRAVREQLIDGEWARAVATAVNDERRRLEQLAATAPSARARRRAQTRMVGVGVEVQP